MMGRIGLRLIEPDELAAWNVLVDEKHYLSSRLVGPTLRFVAEVDGNWVGLLSFGQACYHLQHRDSLIGWTDVQRGASRPSWIQSISRAPAIGLQAGSGLARRPAMRAAARISTRSITVRRSCGSRCLTAAGSIASRASACRTVTTDAQPHAQDCTDYGDRIEWRQLWARATMKMMAIFLCQIGAHQPQSDRECSLPEFNRACAINGIDTAISWLTRKYNPIKR